MAKRGRPTDYKPEFVEQAKKLCLLGATDLEIADFFEVSTVTINAWKERYPEFLNSLQIGKFPPDERVQRSLYHRAIGYSFDSEEIYCKDGEITRVPVRKHVPPDTTACIFWLKNRRAQQWRDVHKHEIGRPGDFDGLAAEELRTLITRETEALGLGHAPAPATNGSGKPH